MAKNVAEINKRLDELRTEGHGPQRHLDPTDTHLSARLGDPIIDPRTGTPELKGNGHVRAQNFIDPMSGTTTDAVTGGPHRCGEFSTRFDSAEDYVAAERYMREHLGSAPVAQGSVPIADVLGPEAHQRMTGYYHDPSAPGEHRPVDFAGGTIFASYSRDADGNLRLRTMYVNPVPFNPGQLDGTDQ